MAITFDAASASGGKNVTTHPTISHTIGSGSDRMLAAWALQEDPVTQALVSTFTYNGTALVFSNGRAGDNRAGGYAYYLGEGSLPAGGAYNLILVWDGNCQDSMAGCISLAGVKDQAPEATGANGSGSDESSGSASITTVTANAWVLIGNVIGGNYVLSYDTSNQRATGNTIGANSSVGDEAVATAGAKSIGWTATSARFWTMVLMAFEAAGAAGSNLVKITNEVVNKIEAKATNQTLIRILDEVENFNETSTRAQAITRVLDEVENFNDSAVETKKITQVLDEVMNISETIVDVLATGLIKVIVEVINFNESTNRVQAQNRIINETMNMVEALALSQIIIRVLSEVENFNETVSLAEAKTRITSETLNINESDIYTKAISLAIDEALNIPENAVNILAALVLQVVNETININENTVDILAGAIVEIISETLNLPEGTINTKTIAISIVEIINTSETLDVAITRIRVLFEALNIQENAQNVSVFIRVINETLDVVEGLAKTTGQAVVQAISAMFKLFPGIGVATKVKPTISSSKPKVRPSDE